MLVHRVCRYELDCMTEYVVTRWYRAPEVRSSMSGAALTILVFMHVVFY